jgi:hypothetical protein
MTLPKKFGKGKREWNLASKEFIEHSNKNKVFFWNYLSRFLF